MRVRVLVVDDSATIRGLIAATLQEDPEIEVVGQAADPLEARQAIKLLNPDVVTLDIEMPNMNGLDFLERIMRLRPTPVIMVSSLTQKGAQTTLQALEIGAFDCVAKPTLGAPVFFDLAEKVKAAAQAKMRPRALPVRRAEQAEPFLSDGRIVVIGSSTGGVEALIEVLSGFPANCPPTLITQHMPPTFTKSFAERLNRVCAAEVAEATDGAPVTPGQVYLARGGMHLELGAGVPPRCRLREGDAVSGHRPSVDVLFGSVARVSGRRAVGVILTGMGRDGATGLLAMRQAGAETIGQDEATSIVYGMPKAAFVGGAVATQLPLNRISGRVLAMTNVYRKERT